MSVDDGRQAEMAESEVKAKKKFGNGIWGAAGILVFGIVFFVYSLQFPYTSEIGPGPGLFPLWLSGMLILLGLLYLRNVLKGNDTSEKMPDRKGLRKVLFTIGSMIVYVALLPHLGFTTASTAFLFVLLLKSYRWYVNLAISIGTSAFLYALFALFLGVQLPLNLLGF